jgi:hypothetical protein
MNFDELGCLDLSSIICLMLGSPCCIYYCQGRSQYRTSAMAGKAREKRGGKEANED